MSLARLLGERNAQGQWVGPLRLGSLWAAASRGGSRDGPGLPPRGAGMLREVGWLEPSSATRSGSAGAPRTDAAAHNGQLLIEHSTIELQVRALAERRFDYVSAASLVFYTSPEREERTPKVAGPAGPPRSSTDESQRLGGAKSRGPDATTQIRSETRI